MDQIKIKKINIILQIRTFFFFSRDPKNNKNKMTQRHKLRGVWVHSDLSKPYPLTETSVTIDSRTRVW